MPDAVTVQVKDENGTSATAKYCNCDSSHQPEKMCQRLVNKESTNWDWSLKETRSTRLSGRNSTSKIVVMERRWKRQRLERYEGWRKSWVPIRLILTGEVTSTPNKDFVGTPDAVTVQIKDENGTTAVHTNCDGSNANRRRNFNGRSRKAQTAKPTLQKVTRKYH